MKTIKNLRIEHNLNEEELGYALGYTADDVRTWENNQPDLAGEVIIKLAKFFGVTSDSLLGVSEQGETDQVLLKSEKIKDIAHEILKIKTDIELIRAMSEMFPSMDQIGEGELVVNYYKAYEYFDLLFTKFQDLEENLETIGTTLFAVDNLLDLKSYVRDKDINFPE